MSAGWVIVTAIYLVGAAEVHANATHPDPDRRTPLTGAIAILVGGAVVLFGGYALVRWLVQ